MKYLSLLFLVAGICQAAVAPNGLFTDQMVLQRNQKVRVYGTADDGEKVTVSFHGQTVSAKTSKGVWEVLLKPMKHGGPYDMTIKGKNTVVLKDILIGDVWILGGQSNMGRTMKAYKWLMNCRPTMEENDKIRLFCFQPSTAVDEPTKHIATDKHFDGTWQHCKREYLPHFSPLGYFFGIQRYKMNKVPIGLVYAARGATRVESWVPRSVLESDPAYAHILDTQENKNYHPDKKGKPNVLRPTALYNGMIHPLIPFTIKGVLWNQGESDSRDPETYTKLFPEMIRFWRKSWNQGDFPFVYAEISSNKDRTWSIAKNPREESWAWQREAQASGLKEPNTIMVSAYDLGEWEDIHPQDKETLAKRYALAAAKLEGEKVVATGPKYKSHQAKGNKIIITFENSQGGLMAKRVAMNKNKGLEPGSDPEAFVAPADKLVGFVICGEDKIFHDAEAKIVGKSVVVTSPDVPKPVAVRYAWATFALANLYSQAGQPAFPFRIDSFDRPPLLRQKKAKKMNK